MQEKVQYTCDGETLKIFGVSYNVKGTGLFEKNASGAYESAMLDGILKASGALKFEQVKAIVQNTLKGICKAIATNADEQAATNAAMLKTELVKNQKFLDVLHKAQDKAQEYAKNAGAIVSRYSLERAPEPVRKSDEKKVRLVTKSGATFDTIRREFAGTGQDISVHLRDDGWVITVAMPDVFDAYAPVRACVDELNGLIARKQSELGLHFNFLHAKFAPNFQDFALETQLKKAAPGMGTHSASGTRNVGAIAKGFKLDGATFANAREVCQVIGLPAWVSSDGKENFGEALRKWASKSENAGRLEKVY